MEYLNCYICNSETKLQKSVRIRTKTKYSAVGVHDIIQSFIKESQRLRFSPNDIVCERCFNKINQYDLACQMAEEIQRDITNALYATEQEYLNEEPIVEYLEEVQNSDKISYQKDFQEFQERYELQHLQEKSHQTECETEVIISNIEVDDTFYSPSISKTTTEQLHDQRKKNEECCNKCDILRFSTKKELKRHYLRYHTPKKCGVCQNVLENLLELKTHARVHHEIEHDSNDEIEDKRDTTQNVNQISFRCDICGLTENTEHALSKHFERHDNQLKCVVCGTILKRKANLLLHMRIHADKKFFKCNKCDKTFVHKSSLRMHLQTTHTDVRNKECKECPLKFKTTSQLNQHMVTHTGIKNHVCPECGKAFAQKYNMTAHYRSHFAQRSRRGRLKAKSSSTDDTKIVC